MNTSIWKFEINTAEPTLMPLNAEILTTNIQSGKMFVLAEVDIKEARTQRRNFQVVGTGGMLPKAAQVRKYINTIFDGPFVWHVYEIL